MSGPLSTHLETVELRSDRRGSDRGELEIGPTASPASHCTTDQTTLYGGWAVLCRYVCDPGSRLVSGPLSTRHETVELRSDRRGSNTGEPEIGPTASPATRCTHTRLHSTAAGSSSAQGFGDPGSRLVSVSLSKRHETAGLRSVRRGSDRGEPEIGPTASPASHCTHTGLADHTQRRLGPQAFP